MAGDGPAYERAGAALATVTAEYVTFFIGLLMARRVLALRGFPGDAEKRLARRYRRLLALNRDIMLRSLLLALLRAVTVFGARLGADIVAVNAVLMTMLTFTAYALDGFAYAGRGALRAGLRRA
jgi:MATE family multidrug resistance protein